MPLHIILIITLSILGYLLVGSVLYVLEAFLKDEDRFRNPNLIIFFWLPFILLVGVLAPFWLLGDLMKSLRKKIEDRQDRIRVERQRLQREKENERAAEARRRQEHAMRYL